MSDSPAATTTATPAPSRLARIDIAVAAALALGAGVLFVATLCPTIYTEDSPEFSTAAATFGVPHPPGYPLYTMLAGLFVRAVPVGDLAYRSNLFSAVCGALTVALLWLLIRRLGIGRLAALAATLCFAFGRTFWSQCLAAEVHALECLLLTTALLATIEAARAPTKLRFAVVGAAVGLLVGHRNLNVLFVPAIFALIEVGRRRVQGCICFHSWASGAAVAAFAVYLYLPLAGRHDPLLYMGAPSSWGRFYAVVTAQPYFRHFASGPASADVGRVVEFVLGLPANLGVGAFAAPVGLAVARRRTGPLLPAALIYIAAVTVGFAALYNVIDVGAYFLPALLALAISAAFAFDAIPWAVVRRFVVPALALAGLPIALGSGVSLRGTRLADGYGRDLLRSAPPNAIVIPFGDTAKHALVYLQAVEHQRPDVVTVSADDIAGWYVEQLQRRHPEVAWPTEPVGAAIGHAGGVANNNSVWFMTFVKDNLSKRPVCLTHPLTLGLTDWTATPTGLLYCFRSKAEPRSAADLAAAVAFWKDAAQPSPAELSHPDVHVRMVVFAYALARFTLAQALAEAGGAGDLEAARAQAAAVVALRPDDQERAITAASKTIGRGPSHPFALGERAARALRIGASNVKGFREALQQE